MSEQEFDAYLRLLGRFLHLNEDQRESIAAELRDHMEDRLAELLERGYFREDAINTALDEFGDAAALAADFGRVGRRRRWVMRTTAATIGIAATILIVSFLLPENRAFVPAPDLSMADQPVRGGMGHPAASTMPAAERQARSRRGAPVMVATGESQAEREVLRSLAKVLPKVEFPQGTAFEETVEFLRQTGNLSVDVNWNALQLIGVDKTTDTQGLRLRDVRLDRALQILLENVGGAVDVSIGYSVVDGIVRISTAEDLDRHLIVRVYDCQDLIRRPLTEEQKAMLQSQGMLPRPDIGMGAPGMSMDGMPGARGMSQPDVLLRLEREEATRLTELLKRTIASGTWEPDSAVGSVSEYDGLLVVRQTWKVQQSVAEFLGLLRQARAARQPAADGGLSTPFAEVTDLVSHAAAEQIINAGGGSPGEASSGGAGGTATKPAGT